MDNKAIVTNLLEVASELVRCEGIPDPTLDEFRPMGKKAIELLRRKQFRRGWRINKAIEAIRKAEQNNDQP